MGVLNGFRRLRRKSREIFLSAKSLIFTLKQRWEEMGCSRMAIFGIWSVIG